MSMTLRKPSTRWKLSFSKHSILWFTSHPMDTIDIELKLLILHPDWLPHLHCSPCRQFFPTLQGGSLQVGKNPIRKIVRLALMLTLWILSDPECVEGKLNHAVLLVGYNKTAPEVYIPYFCIYWLWIYIHFFFFFYIYAIWFQPYWIVKNSWGKNWGQVICYFSFIPPKNWSPTNLPPCITKFNQCHITKDGYIHIKMGENVCGLAKRPVYPVLDIYM